VGLISAASFAGYRIFTYAFPTLRFATRGASTLSDCFAASIRIDF